MFLGKKALIFCKQFGFSLKSGQIIEQKIAQNGGQAQIFTPSTPLNGFTHLIVSPQITPSLLSDLLSKLPSAIAVTPDWASESLAQKSTQPEAPYIPLQLKRRPPPSVCPPKATPKSDPLYMNPSRVKTSNLNAHLTDELQKIESYYHVLGDRTRSISYSNVIRSLKLLSFKVHDLDQIRDLKGVGPKMVLKLKELLQLGHSPKIDKLMKDPRFLALNQLTSVHGIGTYIARSLYSKGITSLKGLQDYAREHPQEFTQAQLASISICEDLQIKIKRSEVEVISQIVKDKLPSSVLFQTCGSYRRGRQLCGDIDIVMACESYQQVLAQLLKELEECGLVTHSFTKSSHKFMGVVRLPGKPHRRLDIYATSAQNFWYAVLYFTGSTNYNRMIRAEAGRRQFHLSNTGLYDLKTGELALVPGCEEDIIRFLGLPVLTLNQRDIQWLALTFMCFSCSVPTFVQAIFNDLAQQRHSSYSYSALESQRFRPPFWKAYLRQSTVQTIA